MEPEEKDGSIWAALAGIIILMLASAAFICITMKLNGVWLW